MDAFADDVLTEEGAEDARHLTWLMLLVKQAGGFVELKVGMILDVLWYGLDVVEKDVEG